MRRGRSPRRPHPARAALRRPRAEGGRADRGLDEGAELRGGRDPHRRGARRGRGLCYRGRGGAGHASRGPGTSWGETALFMGAAPPATPPAETAVKAWGMTMWDFRPLVEGNAALSWKMLQAMAKQLHAAEARAAGVS